MKASHLATLTFWERLAVALLVRSPRTSLVVVKERDTSTVFVSACMAAGCFSSAIAPTVPGTAV